MNDSLIIYTLSIFFIVSGAILGLINTEFNDSHSTTNPGIDDIQHEFTEASGLGYLTFWNVIKGIGKMSFFTFGDIPPFIDWILLMPLRLLFLFTLSRNIWIGGGG